MGCVRLLPKQRELVKQMEGRPFTLLGINCDGDRSVLKGHFEKHGITWPNIIGGEPWKNELYKKWNVAGIATIYILDHEGKIYKRGYLTHEEVTQAVNELMAKLLK